VPVLEGFEPPPVALHAMYPATAPACQDTGLRRLPDQPVPQASSRRAGLKAYLIFW
jgi:hypothetical protein